MMHDQMPHANYNMDIPKKIKSQKGNKKKPGRVQKVGCWISCNLEHIDITRWEIPQKKKTPDETVVLVTHAAREFLFCCTGVQTPVNQDPRSLVLFPVMILSFKVDQTTLV